MSIFKTTKNQSTFTNTTDQDTYIIDRNVGVLSLGAMGSPEVDGSGRLVGADGDSFVFDGLAQQYKFRYKSSSGVLVITDPKNKAYHVAVQVDRVDGAEIKLIFADGSLDAAVQWTDSVKPKLYIGHDEVIQKIGAKAKLSGLVLQAIYGSADHTGDFSADYFKPLTLSADSLEAAVDGVDEGGVVHFVLHAPGVTAGTQFQYTILGVSAADVVGGSLTGYATVGPDGHADIAISLVEDHLSEAAENLILNVADSFATVVVNDTSLTPEFPDSTFDLSSIVGNADEGGTVYFTLQTTNVPAGTQYAYTLTGVTSGDVAGGSLSGIVTIDATGKALVLVNLLEDHLTEGAEALTLHVAGQSSSVTINDTSLTPVFPGASFALDSNSVSSVDEGSTVYFTLQATNVPAGTQYAYSLTGVAAADVIGGSLSGVVTIDATGKAIVSVNLIEDHLTEGAETLTLHVAGQSHSVTINDTSLGQQAGPAQSQTFILTLGVDAGPTFAGGDADDIFNAGLVRGDLGALTNTLNELDSLEGGLGSDTLNAVLTHSVTPTWLHSIENINVTAVSDSTLDLANAPDVELVKSLRSTAPLTLDHLLWSLGGGDSGPVVSGTQVVISDSTQAHTLKYYDPTLVRDYGATPPEGPFAEVKVANFKGDLIVERGDGEILPALNLASEKTNSGASNDVTMNAEFSGGINIFGSAPIKLTAVATDYVDARNLTGNLTLSAAAVGDGENVLYGGSGKDTIYGGIDNDTIDGGANNDNLNGDDGDDTLTGGAGADVIDAGTGYDQVVIAAADISATNGSVAAATFAAAGDVIEGLSNPDVEDLDSDTLDLDLTGFTGGDLADLAVATAADLTASGAISGGGVLVHDAAVGVAGTDAVVAGVVQTAFITAALNVITTTGAGTNSASTSDGYVAIYDQAGDGTADLAIFKVDHAAGSANITAAEVTFVGVLVDFGTTLTDGFVI